MAIPALSLASLVLPWPAIAEPLSDRPAPYVCLGSDGAEKPLALSSFIGPADPAIVEIFAGAGASEISGHELSAEERALVDGALASLPRLHRDVLRRHLRRISFLDLQPGSGSALTSRAGLDDASTQFDITLKASLLDETLTGFLNAKEARLFADDGSGLSVAFDADNVDAFTYVLLHEATHIVDQILGLSDDEAGLFRVGVWDDLRTPAEPHASSLAMNTPFRRKPPVPMGDAPGYYEALRASPFVSFYSTAAAAEDLAELAAWRELTSRPGQSLMLRIRDEEGRTVYQYEPLKSPEVQSRFEAMQAFLERYERECPVD